jgi:succinate dehydrogenase/fumarate reductase flavoprotein subunit
VTAWDEEYDVVILGAGAAGMTAALVSAVLGRRTLLVEKTDKVGGTTARSGGAVWIPNNPQQVAAGMGDDSAMQYLDALVGARAERELRRSFVERGPRMLEFLGLNSEVQFQLCPEEPDYRQGLPGASKGGRALRAREFDGRSLGGNFERIAAPLPELMVFGKIMVTRADVTRLLRFMQSWDAFGFAARLFTRYLGDRVRYSRGTRLVLGNALIARLFHSLLQRNVPMWFDAMTQGLVEREGQVVGLVVRRDGAELRVRARNGVVLAGGGFAASRELRGRFLPEPVATHTPAYEGCTGDTLLFAERIGAGVATDSDGAFWFPSSLGMRRDGSTAVFPHIVLDRGKPGLIAVNASGERFVNEASPYHEFVRAMYRSHATVPTVPAMLVCDRTFLWKYGLGMIHPHTLNLRPFLRSGYLFTAGKMTDLAALIGVAPAGLDESVARHNAFARSGIDKDFNKGQNAYDRANGDKAHAPNPCIGTIDTPPYYAVAVYPTPLATSTGLSANGDGQVLDRSGRVIPGLYVCGNDMASPMGGEYPGPGAQIGVAMTFAYLAAAHAAAHGETPPTTRTRSRPVR